MTDSEVPGETPKERGVRKVLTGTTSEFGEGILIPLLYFVKHFENDQFRRARHVDAWIKMGMPQPVTGYDKAFVDDVQMFINVELHVQKMGGRKRGAKHKPHEIALSRLIEMSFYGASDHTYGLQTCPKFPKELNDKIEQLRDLALTYRMYQFNVKDGSIMTIDHVDKMWDLVKDVALEIDRKVFEIDDADLGEYD